MGAFGGEDRKEGEYRIICAACKKNDHNNCQSRDNVSIACECPACYEQIKEEAEYTVPWEGW